MGNREANALGPLRRSSLIPRELVHRSAPSGVLLTEVRRTGADAFEAAAHWPCAHPTFDRSGDGRHNPLMVAETLRQVGLAVPLGFYDVAPDAHFLIEELRFSLDPDAEPLASHGGSEITCEIGVLRTRPGAPAPPRSLLVSVRCHSQGREFAAGSGVARILTPAAFETVRRRRADSGPPGVEQLIPVRPAEVGVAQPADVMIALDHDGGVRLAPADPYHPFFYDHASDHVPGMVLIEAARQTVAWLTREPRSRIVACALTASRFTEALPAARITCTRAGAFAGFEIRQGERRTAAGSFRFASGARPGEGAAATGPRIGAHQARAGPLARVTRR